MAIGCANSTGDLEKQVDDKKYSWKYPQRTDKVEHYTGVIVYCFDIQSTTILSVLDR